MGKVRFPKLVFVDNVSIKIEFEPSMKEVDGISFCKNTPAHVSTKSNVASTYYGAAAIWLNLVNVGKFVRSDVSAEFYTVNQCCVVCWSLANIGAEEMYEYRLANNGPFGVDFLNNEICPCFNLSKLFLSVGYSLTECKRTIGVYRRFTGLANSERVQQSGVKCKSSGTYNNNPTTKKFLPVWFLFIVQFVCAAGGLFVVAAGAGFHWIRWNWRVPIIIGGVGLLVLSHLIAGLIVNQELGILHAARHIFEVV